MVIEESLQYQRKTQPLCVFCATVKHQNARCKCADPVNETKNLTLPGFMAAHKEHGKEESDLLQIVVAWFGGRLEEGSMVIGIIKSTYLDDRHLTSSLASHNLLMNQPALPRGQANHALENSAFLSAARQIALQVICNRPGASQQQGCACTVSLQL